MIYRDSVWFLLYRRTMSTLFYRNWERVTSTIGYFFLWWAVLHHFRIIPLLGKNQLAPQGIFKLLQFLYRITPRILYENHGNSWNQLKPRQEKPCLWGKISKWSDSAAVSPCVYVTELSMCQKIFSAEFHFVNIINYTVQGWSGNNLSL